MPVLERPFVGCQRPQVADVPSRPMLPSRCSEQATGPTSSIPGASPTKQAALPQFLRTPEHAWPLCTGQYSGCGLCMHWPRQWLQQRCQQTRGGPAKWCLGGVGGPGESGIQTREGDVKNRAMERLWTGAKRGLDLHPKRYGLTRDAGVWVRIRWRAGGRPGRCAVEHGLLYV